MPRRNSSSDSSDEWLPKVQKPKPKTSRSKIRRSPYHLRIRPHPSTSTENVDVMTEQSIANIDDNGEKSKLRLNRRPSLRPIRKRRAISDDQGFDTKYIRQQPQKSREKTRKLKKTLKTQKRRDVDYYNTSDEEKSDGTDYEPVPDPEVIELFTLGPRTNLCQFCDALHFPGVHCCCDNGRVFITPFKPFPPYMEQLIFGTDSKRSHYLENIVTYNTAFAFASIQFHNIKVAPFGAQVPKVQGSFRHFGSAAREYQNVRPRFGNLYTYGTEIAANLRSTMRCQLDQEIVKHLTSCLNEINPFAKIYRYLGERIDELEQTGDPVERLLVSVIDPRDYHGQLQGHKGIYRFNEANQDWVSIFFSASVEQDISLPGYHVYSKLGNHIPQPIPAYRREITPLCYPLLFPMGDPGWSWKGHRLQKEKILYCDRIWELHQRKEDFKKLGYDKMSNAFIENLFQKHGVITTSKTVSGDPNIEDSDHEDVSDSDNESLVNIDEFHEVESLTSSAIDVKPDQLHDVITHVEQGGEMYPVRHRIFDPNYQEVSESEYDSGESIHDDEEPQTHAELDSEIPSTSQQVPTEPPHYNNDVPREHILPQISNKGKREFVSFRQYGLFIHQERRHIRNRISANRKLGQRLTLDLYTRLMQMRSDAIRLTHLQHQHTTRRKFFEAMQQRIQRSHINRSIGYVSFVPAAVPGSPQYLNQKYEETVAMANKYGRPDLFVTLTTNTGWMEIKNNVANGETWADHPFLVNEIFKKKLDAFTDYVLGKKIQNVYHKRQKGLFGFVRWYSMSVEFQARGPPHIHMIISLRRHIRSVADVDRITQAVLPVVPSPDDPLYEVKLRLRELVERYMMHRKCDDNLEAYCRKGCPAHWKVCKKGFPAEFSDVTSLGDKHYPQLRRPNNGETCIIKNRDGTTLEMDNRWVVPYNTQILSKFECHCNVEVITSLKVVKYIYKYLYKGFDRVLVDTIADIRSGGGQMTSQGHILYPKNLKIPEGAIIARNNEAKKILLANKIAELDSNGKPVLVYDEGHLIEDMRAATPCEAAYEFAGYKRSQLSHTVVPLTVHAPFEEPVEFEAGTEDETYERMKSHAPPSKLKAWFMLNKSKKDEDQIAKSLPFEEIPREFRYNAKKGEWKRRIYNTKEHTFGRVYSIHPRKKEEFAIRLLTKVQKGASSFEELKTVNNVEHATFTEAAKALNLMDNQQEWDDTLAEAAQEQFPNKLRRLFASILLFCAVSDPRQLYEKYKVEMFERNDFWTTEKKESQALHHLASCLRAHCFQLRDFNLPEFNPSDLPENGLCDDCDGQQLSPDHAVETANLLVNQLNEEQRLIYDEIISQFTEGNYNPFTKKHHYGSKKSFFIDGSAGTGKTFLYKAIYYSLTAMKKKVLCVAHTGIAATLLPFGTTAHRAFHIPLKTEETMTCKIDEESDYADYLRQLDCVLWDEAPMSDRRIIKAVHNLFVTLHPEGNPSLPFSGILPFIFGGDFKQLLPVVEGVSDPSIGDYSLLHFDLWKHFKKVRLTFNVRAQDDPEHFTWINSIGKGDESCEFIEKVQIPEKNLVDSDSMLIDSVFPMEQLEGKSCDYAAILTPDNNGSLEINERILRRLRGQYKVYESRDQHNATYGLKALPPEIYNMLTPSGMPKHKLKLKVGAPVILLRNINVYLGLANGTRLKVVKMGEKIITCAPITGNSRTPDTVYIHRMTMQANNRPYTELAFDRVQFPIRLSYSMTIHKSQGQTLERVGLLLRTPCFAHGQFFVGGSRVRKGENLFIFNDNEEKTETINIVYKNILRELEIIRSKVMEPPAKKNKSNFSTDDFPPDLMRIDDLVCDELTNSTQLLIVTVRKMEKGYFRNPNTKKLELIAQDEKYNLIQMSAWNEMAEKFKSLSSGEVIFFDNVNCSVPTKETAEFLFKKGIRTDKCLTLEEMSTATKNVTLTKNYTAEKMKLLKPESLYTDPDHLELTNGRLFKGKLNKMRLANPASLEFRIKNDQRIQVSFFEPQRTLYMEKIKDLKLGKDYVVEGGFTTKSEEKTYTDYKLNFYDNLVIIKCNDEIIDLDRMPTCSLDDVQKEFKYNAVYKLNLVAVKDSVHSKRINTTEVEMIEEQLIEDPKSARRIIVNEVPQDMKKRDIFTMAVKFNEKHGTAYAQCIKLEPKGKTTKEVPPVWMIPYMNLLFTNSPDKSEIEADQPGPSSMK